jgi:hypothetical protein
MPLGPSEEQVPLAGVPDGLVAVALRQTRPGVDGQRVEVRTRRGQRKTDRVELVAAGEPAEPLLDDSEWRWLLVAGQRRWAGVTSRYGDQAWARAVELARGGVVRLRCGVDERMGVGQPQGWVLTERWEARRAEAASLRELDRDAMSSRARAAAAAVAGRSPELAAALQAAAPGNPTTAVLVFAAEDLVDGVVHAGPRAFSQAHLEHTKARDDVAQILRDAGVPDEVLVELGIRRSARIGVAGPLRAIVDERQIALDALDGPVLLRTDQRGLRLQFTRDAALVIVENLQAAETLADQMPELVVIYTAGLPGRAALRLIGDLATQAARVLVVPDADLGGVRIASDILEVAPHGVLLDVGEIEHAARDRWPDGGVSVRGLQRYLSGPAGELARACLERGYPVEQEMLTVAVTRQALRGDEAAVQG